MNRSRTCDHDDERRKLLKWLMEWDIYRRVMSEVGFDRAAYTWVGGASKGCSGGGGVLPGRHGHVDRPLAVGQVRLLRPVAAGDPAARPLFVAVLEARSVGGWLVVPFSRFVNPAVPGEVMTLMRAVPLRVLCVWNARVVEGNVLGATWFSGTMQAARVREALGVWRQLRVGGPVTRVDRGRLGPALRHPLDPRHEYMQEEMALMDLHLGHRGSGFGVVCGTEYEVPESAPLKAAEGRARYGLDGKGE